MTFGNLYYLYHKVITPNGGQPRGHRTKWNPATPPQNARAARRGQSPRSSHWRCSGGLSPAARHHPSWALGYSTCSDRCTPRCLHVAIRSMLQDETPTVCAQHIVFLLLIHAQLTPTIRPRHWKSIRRQVGGHLAGAIYARTVQGCMRHALGRSAASEQAATALRTSCAHVPSRASTRPYRLRALYALN